MELLKEDRKSLELLDSNLTGSELEEEFFNKLQFAMEKSEIKDTFVISGWSDNGEKGRKMREFDYLSVEEAIRQLEDGKKFFLSCIPFPQDENWRYIQGMYIGNKVGNEFGQPCSSCQNFMLTKGDDLSSWWIGLVNQLTENEEGCTNYPTTTYFGILKYLIFQMFLQDDCITKGLN